jgi:NADH-quinone oxidoreductase subunit K
MIVPDIPPTAYLIVGAALFAIGAIGVLTRRNALVIFMSIELMLNSVNLSLIAFSHALNSIDGVLFVFFVMAVAAAEAGVGLAIFVQVYRTQKTVQVDEVRLMKW